MPSHHRHRPVLPRNRRWLVWLVLAGFGAAGVIYNDLTRTNTISGPGAITGRATAGDGDSLRIQNTRIRLVDIDAPELDQCCRDGNGTLIRCGAIARDHLIRLIGGREVSCSWRETDPNGRALATCSIGTLDINARMVEDGHAIPYHRRSGSSGWRASTVYRTEAERALSGRKGLHGYRDFEPPHVFRANQRAGQKPRLAGC